MHPRGDIWLLIRRFVIAIVLESPIATQVAWFIEDCSIAFALLCSSLSEDLPGRAGKTGGLPGSCTANPSFPSSPHTSGSIVGAGRASGDFRARFPIVLNNPVACS
jgi:hypothetical protein